MNAGYGTVDGPDAHPDPSISDAASSTSKQCLSSTFILHPDTINSIEQHVDNEPKPNKASLRQDCQQRINQHDRVLVQGMKSDAATAGIVNRIRQQMVYIDQHCREHDEPCPDEILFEENSCDRTWHGCVKKHVNYGSYQLSTLYRCLITPLLDVLSAAA